MKIFVYAVIGLVAVVVIVGIVLVGSPTNERARQFDMRRVSDLQNIQSQVVSYWQRKGELPKDREAIQQETADISFQDPETGVFYRYEPAPLGTRINAMTTFFLCATFTSSRYEADEKVPSKISPSALRPLTTARFMELWDHPAGGYCFERTIDPSLYPPIQNPKATGGCLITGCSGQVCADKEVVTTCDFQPQYACYKQYSRCERQGNGQCGWTQTKELVQCLSTAPAALPSKPAPVPR